VEKYLRQYAEPATAAIATLPADEPWNQVVVIPVCNEAAGILRPLPPAAGRSLMIVVVNETEGAAQHVSQANQDFVAELNQRFRTSWQSPAGLTLFNDPATPRDILLADRYSDGFRFPARGGVGLARKTGADLAAWLVHESRVLSRWIHCSDADVHLPERYFDCIPETGGAGAREIAAMVYPFRHVSGDVADRISQVTRLYEYSLRYYVAGLNYAGSPYAFHTIGSTIAVEAHSYVRVRGFPRRQAGEDFYLLNKLAKVGSIRQLTAGKECEPIEIEARLSDRVPFGTGAATGKIMELNDPADSFLLYHPGVFDLLRQWLVGLEDFWRQKSCDPAMLSTQSDFRILSEGLVQIGTEEALKHALRQSSDVSQFMRQMHTWFDAFRTLKLIHYLRDHHLPSVSFNSLTTAHDIDHLWSHEPDLLQLHEILREQEWK
jgi:hypothetical protein